MLNSIGRFDGIPTGFGRAAGVPSAAMSSSALGHAIRSGDLISVALPPGRSWIPVLRAAREIGAAVLPVDVRLSPTEQQALLDRARPTVVIDAEGTRRVDGVAIDPEIALVIATSGTSGQPRLAELTMAALEAAITASASAIGARLKDRWLSCLPLAHIGGLLVVYRHLLLGAPITFRRRLSPAAVAATSDARFTSMVPTQLVRLLDAEAVLSHFRTVLVGGSGMDAGLAIRAASAGVRAVQTYGMSETCGGVVYGGRPLAGVSVRCEPTGELLVSGPTLMRGYRLDPKATAAAFTEDGWLRTGDGGEVTADGTVLVKGRLADVIVSGGEKIWPAEVEAALSGHEDVEEVLVSGTADSEWGQRVVARVVPRNTSEPPSLESLREFAATTIARHKLPREVIIVDHLDRTAIGKIRRS
jgi:O-succinylbenzoic acid--CoA ligase